MHINWSLLMFYARHFTVNWICLVFAELVSYINFCRISSDIAPNLGVSFSVHCVQAPCEIPLCTSVHCVQSPCDIPLCTSVHCMQSPCDIPICTSVHCVQAPCDIPLCTSVHCVQAPCDIPLCTSVNCVQAPCDIPLCTSAHGVCLVTLVTYRLLTRGAHNYVILVRLKKEGHVLGHAGNTRWILARMTETHNSLMVIIRTNHCAIRENCDLSATCL
jgi:hypothetical protein